jgi:hypothetical protein
MRPSTYLCRGQTTHTPTPGARRRHAVDRPRVKVRREGGAANVIVRQTNTVYVLRRFSRAEPSAAMSWYPVVNLAARAIWSTPSPFQQARTQLR